MTHYGSRFLPIYSNERGQSFLGVSVLKNIGRLGSLPVLGFCLLLPYSTTAADSSVAVTASALRMAGTMTGGLMPTSDPTFAQMVTSIQAGNYYDAAMAATTSKYFTKYLVRRMAKQMMNPTMSAAGIPDNDATTFIVGNLMGAGTTANISKLWSDNATYLINVAGVQKHAMDLSATELANVNWNTDLVRVAGQTAKDTNGQGAAIAIPLKHVGGYVTLSDRNNDQSLAQYGFNAGTNLRGIEALYEISMGLTLTQMISMEGAKSQVVPRFVPENDPNFFVGQGQPACISCHGGGASNLTHGYATMADVFDFDGGLVFIGAPTTSTKKSLGSNAGNRGKTLTCNLAQFTTCNPDSYGADANQSWDLTSWQQGGLLTQMDWQGPITGQGLNALGTAVGQAGLVYKYLVQRVIQEICPQGSISATQVSTIAKNAQSKDSFAYIVASVASDASCR